jgi:hypothetical protein
MLRFNSEMRHLANRRVNDHAPQLSAHTVATPDLASDRELRRLARRRFAHNAPSCLLGVGGHQPDLVWHLDGRDGANGALNRTRSQMSDTSLI